jgi:hypothetical protein
LRYMTSKIIFVYEKRICVEFRQNRPQNSHNPYLYTLRIF